MSVQTDVGVIIEPSAEISRLVADLGTDWPELLRQEGLQVRQTVGADPSKAGGSSEKEPVTILLATAGLVMSLAPALARVLTALSRRPVKVSEMVMVPVEDSKGGVVKDSAGNPILHWVERARLLESQDPRPAKSSTSLEGPLGLKLKIDESA